MKIRRVTPEDRGWIADVLTAHFASTRIVSRGHVYEEPRGMASAKADGGGGDAED